LKQLSLDNDQMIPYLLKVVNAHDKQQPIPPIPLLQHKILTTPVISSGEASKCKVTEQWVQVDEDNIDGGKRQRMNEVLSDGSLSGSSSRQEDQPDGDEVNRTTVWVMSKGEAERIWTVGTYENDNEMYGKYQEPCSCHSVSKSQMATPLSCNDSYTEPLISTLVPAVILTSTTSADAQLTALSLG
jgi:hypothetical protein